MQEIILSEIHISDLNSYAGAYLLNDVFCDVFLFANIYFSAPTYSIGPESKYLSHCWSFVLYLKVKAIFVFTFHIVSHAFSWSVWVTYFILTGRISVHLFVFLHTLKSMLSWALNYVRSSFPFLLSLVFVLPSNSSSLAFATADTRTRTYLLE